MHLLVDWRPIGQSERVVHVAELTVAVPEAGVIDDVPIGARSEGGGIEHQAITRPLHVLPPERRLAAELDIEAAMLDDVAPLLAACGRLEVGGHPRPATLRNHLEFLLRTQEAKVKVPRTIRRGLFAARPLRGPFRVSRPFLQDSPRNFPRFRG